MTDPILENEVLTIEEVELTLQELDDQHRHLMQHIGQSIGEASEIANARGRYSQILFELDKEKKEKEEAEGATRH